MSEGENWREYNVAGRSGVVVPITIDAGRLRV